MSKYKDVTELNRSQLKELKQRYLDQLYDEGCLYEVLFDEPEKDIGEDDGVPQKLIDDVDEVVPDDVIFTRYAHHVFADDDFGY